MDAVFTSRMEVEFSIEWARNNPELFATAYNKFFTDNADWHITSGARPGFLTLIASRDVRNKGTTNTRIPGGFTESAEPTKSGWLRSGSLLYRLTDEPRPQNRDEINVTMAQGSREGDKRERRARQLMDMLERSDKLKEALTWALAWIDAVPEDALLPAMPGFDRDYVNELLELR